SWLDIAQHGDGTGIGPVAGWLVVIGLATGSALTAAYSARFIWGAFADKPGVPSCRPRREAPVGFIAAPAILAVAGFVLGLLGRRETELLSPYTAQFSTGAQDEYLALWSGASLPLDLPLPPDAAGPRALGHR